MNELEFSFESAPWEQYLLNRGMGGTVSAAELLAMLEGAPEEALEEALAAVETGCMELDISGLPGNIAAGEAALRLKREHQLVKGGLTPGALEEGDPLRLYLEEVAAMPAADEAALAAACAEGKEWAREALTNAGLKRVIRLACGYTGCGVLLLDLIQEGSLGLWQAVGSYHGGDYAAHRDRWIRLYLARAVTVQARQRGVGQKLRTAMEDYRAVDERLLAELGRNPTMEEMAQAMHMTAEEAAVVKKTLDNARLLAQAKRPAVDEEEEKEAQEQAVEDTAYFQMRQRIGELLSALAEEDRSLIALRYGLEGGKPLSPEEAGRRLGLTPEEVVAREAAALAKLRSK